MTTDSKKNTGLSLLKSVGVIGIFLYLLGATANFTGYLRLITDFGRYGFLLLFVVSGFLIAKSLDECGDFKAVLKFWLKKAIKLLLLYYLYLLIMLLINTVGFKKSVGIGFLKQVFLLTGIVKSSDSLMFTFVHIYALYLVVAPILYVFLKLNKVWKLAIAFFVFYGLNILQSRFFGGYGSFFKYAYVFTEGMLLYAATKENRLNITYLSALFIACVMLALGKISDLFVSLLFVMLTGFCYNLEIRCKPINFVTGLIDDRCYPALIAATITFFVLSNVSYPPAIAILFALIGTLALTILFYDIFLEFTAKPLAKKLLK